ncbi:MAG: methionine sulfoxide reductase heme-binding subunit [Thermoleophilaceae bacterium]|nr:methionine sulfoxide reductase heme-binding subunit [Thermoleophilaceae bacterium]
MTATIAAAGADGRALWYLTRGTGAVSLLLLTLTVVLGVADVRRLSSPRLPRFVVDGLHQTVSLLVVVTLLIHIGTTLLDSFAPIRLVDAVVPFISAYRPVWIGFGALALDLLLAIVITSLARARLGYRAWRGVHWFAYACWPVALLHGLGSGSDIRGGFALYLSIACAATVAIAVLARLLGRDGRYGPAAAGLAAVVAAGVALAVWLPAGPLADGWAARAGTPGAVLAAAHGRPRAHSSRGTSARPAAPTGVVRAPVNTAVTGRADQVVNPGGATVLRFTLALRQGPLPRLRIELQGKALAGGGLSLSKGRVVLGTSRDPSLYTGPVATLQGGQLSASLRGSRNDLRLALSMQVDPNTNRVSGNVSLVPAQGGG